MDNASNSFDLAISVALGHEKLLREIPHHRRAGYLRQIADQLNVHRDAFAVALTQDIGKTIRESYVEVDRTIDTFRISAEEAVRINGENMAMDRTERGVGMWGITRRFPIGLCGFIAPYNFPLNLAAHKIGPAIAVGNPFVLKMASAAVRTTALFRGVLASVGMPVGSYSVLLGSRSDADQLVTDPRIKLLSFTGSPEVGWDMKARAGKKSVVLELGGNAAVIIESVDSLPDVAKKVAQGAFYQAGQSCISVQRVLVNERCVDGFASELVRATAALRVGDPMDPDTDVGPLVSEGAAVRVSNMIDTAMRSGAKRLVGGERVGAFVSPTILIHCPHDQPIVSEEVFGPVVVIIPYRSFHEALEIVNASRFGLQVGVFCTDYRQVMDTFEKADVGGVVIGNVPSFRLDHLPYGGIKDSGLGREGVRSAIDHMTEEKLLIIAK